MVSWEGNFFQWQFFCFHLLKEGGRSWPFEQWKAVLLKIFITVKLVFLRSTGTEVSASWSDGRSLADSVMGKFRPPGSRLQTSCQKGVILSQVQSTISVTEMTESVDTDIYFQEFGRLAVESCRSLQGQSGEDTTLMTSQILPQFFCKKSKATSLIPALSG